MPGVGGSEPFNVTCSPTRAGSGDHDETFQIKWEINDIAGGKKTPIDAGAGVGGQSFLNNCSMNTLHVH